MHELVGKTVVRLHGDDYPIFAIGEDGYMHLMNCSTGERVGTYAPYNTIITGPEWFSAPLFIECRVDW